MEGPIVLPLNGEDRDEVIAVKEMVSRAFGAAAVKKANRIADVDQTGVVAIQRLLTGRPESSQKLEHQIVDRVADVHGLFALDIKRSRARK